MNFNMVELGAEDRDFLEEVRSFLDEHVTEEVVAEERRSGTGISRTVHRSLGERGWLFPRWSRAEGGAGLEGIRLALLNEELAARPIPYQVVGANELIVEVVRRFASDEIRVELLEAFTSGRVVACLGYTEPDCGSDAAAVKTRAVLDGDEWIIDGQKMFTTGAQAVEYSMVLARTDPDAPKRAGLTMFLVPLDSDGVEVRTLGTMGGESTNMVFYDSVRVHDRFRLGRVGAGWTEVASAALAAEHGMADREVIEVSNPYARAGRRLLTEVIAWARRPDENGSRPIDDASVRRRLADADLKMDLAEITPPPYQRINSSESLIDIAADLLDMVGQRGLLAGGADGAVLDGQAAEAHQFAQGTAIYGGTTDIQRNLIAEHLLGLPRHRGVAAS